MQHCPEPWLDVLRSDHWEQRLFKSYLFRSMGEKQCHTCDEPLCNILFLDLKLYLYMGNSQKSVSEGDPSMLEHNNTNYIKVISVMLNSMSKERKH